MIQVHSRPWFFILQQKINICYHINQVCYCPRIKQNFGIMHKIFQMVYYYWCQETLTLPREGSGVGLGLGQGLGQVQCLGVLFPGRFFARTTTIQLGHAFDIKGKDNSFINDTQREKPKKRLTTRTFKKSNFGWFLLYFSLHNQLRFDNSTE